MPQQVEINIDLTPVAKKVIKPDDIIRAPLHIKPSKLDISKVKEKIEQSKSNKDNGALVMKKLLGMQRESPLDTTAKDYIPEVDRNNDISIFSIEDLALKGKDDSVLSQKKALLNANQEIAANGGQRPITSRRVSTLVKRRILKHKKALLESQKH